MVLNREKRLSSTQILTAQEVGSHNHMHYSGSEKSLPWTRRDLPSMAGRYCITSHTSTVVWVKVGEMSMTQCLLTFGIDGTLQPEQNTSESRGIRCHNPCATIHLVKRCGRYLVCPLADLDVVWKTPSSSGGLYHRLGDSSLLQLLPNVILALPLSLW